MIEMASARDEAYEGASGRRKEDGATPRSVGASKDKRSISSSKFLRKNVSSVSWNVSISGGHSWPWSRRQLSMMRTWCSSKLEILNSVEWQHKHQPVHRLQHATCRQILFDRDVFGYSCVSKTMRGSLLCLHLRGHRLHRSEP